MSKDLKYQLPAPRNRIRTLAKDQTTTDIAKAVLLAEKDNRIYAPILKKFFNTYADQYPDNLQSAFNYVVNKIIYIAETDPQTVKTIPALLKDGFGDCKHFATLMASICFALKIPYFFRLTSYNQYLKQPTHIYICIVIDKKVIPIDPVYKKFAKEKPYIYKWDYKPLN